MPETYVNLAQLKVILMRVKTEYLRALRGLDASIADQIDSLDEAVTERIETSIPDYVKAFSGYVSEESLHDSLGALILDSSNEEIGTTLDVVDSLEDAVAKRINAALQTAIPAAIQAHLDDKHTQTYSTYEIEQPLYDSSEDQILDDSDDGIIARRLLVTL